MSKTVNTTAPGNETGFMGHELTWTAVVTQGSFAATRLEGNRANKIRASIFQQPAEGQQQEEDGTDSKPNNLRKN